MSKTGPRGNIECGQEFFSPLCYDLNLRSRIPVQGQCTAVTKRHSVDKV